MLKVEGSNPALSRVLFCAQNKSDKNSRIIAEPESLAEATQSQHMIDYREDRGN